MNNYNLNPKNDKEKPRLITSLAKLSPLVKEEKVNVIIASIAVLINSALNLAAPLLIGIAIDKYIAAKQFHGVVVYLFALIAIYLAALVANYYQTMIMGTVGQNMLWRLRSMLFDKIQSLPISFFNQNKTGDLISRINNDTDKINQFVSQGLVQFVANIITIIGAAIFIIIINWRLGLISLIPAAALFIITRLLSPWIKRMNSLALNKVGALSAEIAESLENFKVIIAFNRRDYFRERFGTANQENYKRATSAGIANNTLTPVYGLASNAAILLTLAYGIHLISLSMLTVGLLFSFINYIYRLYDPLRQMAQIWSSFQTALASWDRIDNILSLESDLQLISNRSKALVTDKVLEFRNVTFGYTENSSVLKSICFELKKGKTYALVGPTGGGKTTTASLIARLFDPTDGQVMLDGRDIRTYTPKERVKKIGFILQDPILFTGTVRDNLLYAEETCESCSRDQLDKLIHDAGLKVLLKRFPKGLETKVNNGGKDLSLGQKQLIAFMRAVLRKPEILILDEATANIDTVTEILLSEILSNLPTSTTKIIIAHRLNTIKSADEIFFVNDGTITPAGSIENAISLLLNEKRIS